MDTALVVYYEGNDGRNYTEVQVHISGVVDDHEHRWIVAKDWMLVSWQRATSKVCFSENLIQSIMDEEGGHSHSNSRAITYSDVL